MSPMSPNFDWRNITSALLAFLIFHLLLSFIASVFLSGGPVLAFQRLVVRPFWCWQLFLVSLDQVLMMPGVLLFSSLTLFGGDSKEHAASHLRKLLPGRICAILSLVALCAGEVISEHQLKFAMVGLVLLMASTLIDRYFLLRGVAQVTFLACRHALHQLSNASASVHQVLFSPRAVEEWPEDQLDFLNPDEFERQGKKFNDQECLNQQMHTTQLLVFLVSLFYVIVGGWSQAGILAPTLAGTLTLGAVVSLSEAGNV